MALAATGRNLYGPTKFVDISFVFIMIEDDARVAAESSPETTVSNAASGVLNLTFPKAVGGFVVGAPALIGVAGATAAEVVAFSPTAGTMQIDTGSDLSGGDRCHVVLALYNQ
jgi:hypothetical protein